MDRWKPIRQIGHGAFGAAILVQAVTDATKRFVVKLVDVSKMPAKEEEDTLREVHVLASFDHPNIICYVDSFVEVGKLHIVMEYAEDGDLRTLIKEHKAVGRALDEKQILDYFVQLCLAMQHIHQRKVLHRDLKPQNIFLTEQRRVLKVGDFGIARTLEHSLELAHSKVGTPYYMSPEVLNETPYNDKTDVWSMGCVLYELCALRPPFDVPPRTGCEPSSTIRGIGQHAPNPNPNLLIDAPAAGPCAHLPALAHLSPP